MNQLVNLFWTIFGFAPVVYYWWAEGPMLWCYIFILLSALSLLVPFQLVQLSRLAKFYESLGVKSARKLVQNGDYVNRTIRKRKPGYKVVTGRRVAIGYQKTLAMYERYHLFCFTFFLLTAGHAAINKFYGQALVIIIANVIYNVYPILIQQYNRVRISRLANQRSRN